MFNGQRFIHTRMLHSILAGLTCTASSVNPGTWKTVMDGNSLICWLWSQWTTNEPRTGDVEAACSGQIGMAETRDNGYVYDKLLKRGREIS